MSQPKAKEAPGKTVGSHHSKNPDQSHSEILKLLLQEETKLGVYKELRLKKGARIRRIHLMSKGLSR
jgi:hypothetical protein